MKYLRAENLKKSFKTHLAVRGVSFEVPQGKVVGLLGPNGAGKTTSFYMIVGLLHPDEGTVKIDEKEINILQHLKNGKAIPEIAAIMDVRSRLLYQRIGAVKEKLNASETTDAIQMAKTYGLLG